MLGDVYGWSQWQECAQQRADLGASNRALEVLPSAGKMSDICPWWRKEDVYLAKLQEISAQGTESWLPPSLGSIPSFMDVVGPSAGGVFKHNMHVTSCSQVIHFLKLWLIYGVVGACIMPIYLTCCSHYTVFPSLSLRPQAHEKVKFTSFVFCFLCSPHCLPNLIDFPIKIFPQNLFSWCHTGATSPFLCHLSLVLPFPSSFPMLLSCWAWCYIPDSPI